MTLFTQFLAGALPGVFGGKQPMPQQPVSLKDIAFEPSATPPAFQAYPKTPRFNRSVVVTEKIDGSNAQILITDYDECHEGEAVAFGFIEGNPVSMFAGSRNRWVTPGKQTDNYGFASWCAANSDELFKLGMGQHFGEWWGLGIARGYNQPEKRLSLFNTARWGDHNPDTPACCSVVPVLYEGSMDKLDSVLALLREQGSVAAPGFMNPEGIIVYHTASRQPYKVLLDNDSLPKGALQ